MHILAITNSYGADGAAGMLRDFSSHAIKTLGWKIDALATRAPSASALEMIADSGMSLVGNSVNLANYDCILINTLVDLGVIDQIKSPIPIVVWAHEGETLLFNTKWSAAEWTKKFLRARLIIFQTKWQTESAYRSFLYRLPPDRIKVIPNGIPPIKHPGRGERPISEPVKLVSTGLTPRKRPMDLVYATINLNARMSTQCEFVGGLEHFHMLGQDAERLTKDHPKIVKWAGELRGADLHQKLADSDIYCHPSGDESFPLSPLEGAVLGLPVILADLDCYFHVGWKAEVNCLKYPVGDIKKLEQQVERLAKNADLYNSLAQAGKKFAKNADWNKFLLAMTNAIKSACAR